MTLKAGIIGCGEIAKSHAAGYQANNIKIIAVTDINPEAAKAMAAEFGAEIFASAKALIESGKVDMVSICTPPVAHEQDAVCALANGVHVLLEKPQAHNVESAARIKDAATKSQAVLMLAYRHRFLPAIVKIKSYIDEGRLGKLVFIHNIFCGYAFNMKDKWFSKRSIAGGGTMLDTSSHSVDLFRYLAGEIVEQHAVMGHHLEGTDVEDVSIITVKSLSGTLGSLSASWVAADGMAYIDVCGEDGRISYDYCTNELQYKPREGNWEKIEVLQSRGFAEQIGSFITSISLHKQAAITADDGLRAMEVICSNYKV